MEENEAYNYGYSYQQPTDYTSYENYSNPPYISTINEQMLSEQPYVATGAGSYGPVIQPSNIEVETQLDPKLWPANIDAETHPDAKFFQPMELTYGPQTTFESASTALPFVPPPDPTITSIIDTTKRIVKYISFSSLFFF